jgi:hypothetical protein
MISAQSAIQHRTVHHGSHIFWAALMSLDTSFASRISFAHANAEKAHANFGPGKTTL